MKHKNMLFVGLLMILVGSMLYITHPFSVVAGEREITVNYGDEITITTKGIEIQNGSMPDMRPAKKYVSMVILKFLINSNNRLQLTTIYLMNKTRTEQVIVGFKSKDSKWVYNIVPYVSTYKKFVGPTKVVSVPLSDVYFVYVSMTVKNNQGTPTGIMAVYLKFVTSNVLSKSYKYLSFGSVVDTTPPQIVTQPDGQTQTASPMQNVGPTTVIMPVSALLGILLIVFGIGLSVVGVRKK